MKKDLGEISYNVTELELENGVSAGVFLRSLSEESIPPYYEHLYRLKANISLEAWRTMPRFEKAIIIAIMQIERAVEGQQAEAEIQRSKTLAKRSEK